MPCWAGTPSHCSTLPSEATPKSVRSVLRLLTPKSGESLYVYQLGP